MIPMCRKLYNLKAKNGWSDKNFTSLLQLLGEMFSENNSIPDSTYRANKLLCPLSMKVERIHACPNDCILYRNEYKKDTGVRFYEIQDSFIFV
jgi:hypothetical protein